MNPKERRGYGTGSLVIYTGASADIRFLGQGELLALRWRDVDWEAKRIRVRRNYVRGHWPTRSRDGAPERCRCPVKSPQS
jgi:integrase